MSQKKYLSAVGAGLGLSLRSQIRRLFRKRRPRAPEPLHFSSLKHLSSDEWRAALAESPAKTARLIYAAAVYGDIDAQLRWAQMLLDGYGAQQDAEGAFRWFAIAAESGRADAINMLGRCHECGWGTPPDPEKAVACYRKAAAESHDWAQFNLACLLLAGDGVARDPDAAFNLLMNAAKQDHVKSLHMIGQCFEYGWGCRRDLTTAIEWQRRSAEAGDFRGQYRYGQFLVEGGHLEDGLTWLSAAVDSGPAGFCRAIVDDMSRHREPRIRSIGDRALARIAAA